MRRPIPILTLFAALLVTAATAGEGLQEISWWRLVKVIDERTLTLHCENGFDKGRTLTIKLACIGKSQDNREAVAYIKRRLHDHKVSLWPLVTDVAAWEAQPMCVILDMDLPGRGGEAVYDFPLLNEELLAWGRVSYEDVIVKTDPYQLKARLVSAKFDWETRAKEREKRMSKFRQSANDVATNDVVRLRVTVQDVVPLRDFKGALTPTDDFDPRFALTLRINSCVPTLTNLQSGTIVTFAVHSPSMFVDGSAQKGTTHEITMPRRKR